MFFLLFGKLCNIFVRFDKFCNSLYPVAVCERVGLCGHLAKQCVGAQEKENEH